MGLEVRELICKLGFICAGADGKLGNEEGAPYNAIHVGAAAAGMHYGKESGSVVPSQCIYVV